MSSTKTAAELMGILLNASGGCGRKPIGDLKDSHRIEKTRLSSHSASRAVGLQPGPLLGKIRLGFGTQKVRGWPASPSATPLLVKRALLWATGGSSIAMFAHQVNSRQFAVRASFSVQSQAGPGTGPGDRKTAGLFVACCSGLPVPVLFDWALSQGAIRDTTSGRKVRWASSTTVTDKVVDSIIPSASPLIVRM